MKSPYLRRLLLVLLAVAVFAGCWLVPIDRTARTQVEIGLQRALTAFAAARVLGAAISVAQGTQVDVTPGGVGVSLAPGQALQPLNELVDRFAAVMLAASVAFGVQLLLLNMGTHAFVSIAVSAAVLLLVALRWRERADPSARDGGLVLRWVQPFVVTLLLVRFAVPLCGLANEALYRNFMADDYRAALAAVEESKAITGRAAEPSQSTEDSLLERIKRFPRLLPDLKAGYDGMLGAASDWAAKIVRLIALFVLQTVVVPIGFMWLAWRLARAVVRAP